MTSTNDLLSVADAAAALKTTPLNILMHIKKGLLAGAEIDGSWFVSGASLEKFRREAGGAAHGSLCQGKSHCGGCGGKE